MPSRSTRTTTSSRAGGGSAAWTSGDLNSQRVQTANYSQLATITWDDDMMVYYQACDASIRELTRTSSSGAWSETATLPGQMPLVGTGIASVGWNATSTRVYF